VSDASIAAAQLRTATISGSVAAMASLQGTVQTRAILADAMIGSVIIKNDLPTYGGPYEVTPGEQAQRVPVGDKVMREDIIVEAIPQNYGRLSWDGRTLTVY